MKQICVFCGSSPGAMAAYAEAAKLLGRTLARTGLGLVYGGSDVGVMRALANAALGAGAEVVGVIPRALHEKVGHRGLTRQHIVESMHERKNLMFELSDAFIALPGGLGTFEELFEVLAWGQLGYHQKPCGLLNVCGYYDGLLAFLDHAVEERFVRPEHRAIIMVDTEPEGLIEQFRAFRAPVVEKWLDR